MPVSQLFLQGRCHSAAECRNVRLGGSWGRPYPGNGRRGAGAGSCRAGPRRAAPRRRSSPKRRLRNRVSGSRRPEAARGSSAGRRGRREPAPPARTTVVAQLVREGVLVEIDAVAALA